MLKDSEASERRPHHAASSNELVFKRRSGRPLRGSESRTLPAHRGGSERGECGQPPPRRARRGLRGLPGESCGSPKFPMASAAIRYEELNMPYTEAPPLPDGATEADRERLEREALDRLYGR